MAEIFELLRNPQVVSRSGMMLLVLVLLAGYWVLLRPTSSTDCWIQLARPLLKTPPEKSLFAYLPDEPVDAHVSALLEQLARPIAPSLQERNIESGADDVGSCAHRMEHSAYPWPPHNASPAFRAVADAYERFHAKCTAAAGNLSELALSGRPPPCKYIFYSSAVINSGGLGNQLLALTSTLLYGILTSRVLLIGQETVPAPLLCEPFKGSRWRLPRDVPLESSHLPCGSDVEGDPSSVGSWNATLGRSVLVCLDTKHCSIGRSIPFCEADSKALEESDWLAVYSNQYFLPSLYHQERFLPLLRALFPDNRVSTALMRRFFHPRDSVWKQIKRAYADNMADQGYRIGTSLSASSLSGWFTSGCLLYH